MIDEVQEPVLLRIIRVESGFPQVVTGFSPNYLLDQHIHICFFFYVRCSESHDIVA